MRGKKAKAIRQTLRRYMGEDPGQMLGDTRTVRHYYEVKRIDTDGTLVHESAMIVKAGPHGLGKEHEGNAIKLLCVTYTALRQVNSMRRLYKRMKKRGL